MEIIIVDDCSTDNSSNIYNYLLKTDPRIRIFFHLKNMGAWKSRLDGLLYSRGKYVLHFDSGDYFTDNLVMQDVYEVVDKYQLDSVRFSFILATNEKSPYSHANYKMYNKKEFRKIIYGPRDFNVATFEFGPIWVRLFRANTFVKGLDLVDEYIYNAYKNFCEDRWWNQILNRVTFSNLMINRLGYLYLFSYAGEGKVHLIDDNKKDKFIKEIIYYWLVDYYLSKDEKEKAHVADYLNKSRYGFRTYVYQKALVKIDYLLARFKPYEHLLKLILKDPLISEGYKIEINKSLEEYKQKFNITSI